MSGRWMNNWDDLRLFAAAARAGSFARASARVNMDATTIARRVARLERALGSTLVARSARGLTLTAAGQRLFDAATKVEGAVDALTAADEPAALRGVVRLSVSEGFGTMIVAPALPALLAERPGLTIELVANAGFLSPSTREADIAVTLSEPRSPRLVAERLTDYELGLYAARDLIAREGPIADPADLPGRRCVGYIDDLIYAPELRYLAEIHSGLVATATSSSIRAQFELVRGGAGFGVLPCFLADTTPETLERILPRRVRLRRTFWIAAHRDVLATARAQMVVRWLKRLSMQVRARLLPSGETPGGDNSTSRSDPSPTRRAANKISTR